MDSTVLPRRRTALGGLLVRREAWALSIWGKLAAFAAVVALGFAFLLGLYPFLAVTARTPTDTLVIDGWLPTYDLIKAAAEFKRGGYKQLVFVRAVYDFDAIDHDPGSANVVSRVLINAGVPSDRLAPILFAGYQVDRTYYSAVAVGEWFRRHGHPLEAFDLATVGPHARRSRLLYRKALGSVRVGVIALDDPAYEARHWWRFSEGVRDVLFEGVAYVYVRCFFSSPPPTGVRLLSGAPSLAHGIYF